MDTPAIIYCIVLLLCKIKVLSWKYATHNIFVLELGFSIMYLKGNFILTKAMKRHCLLCFFAYFPLFYSSSLPLQI